jgi:hypothetical protein
VYLVLSKLQAAAPPEVLYEVFLAPSREAAGATPSARQHVGTINFFNAVSHGEEAQSLVDDDRFVSFDVTSLVRRWHVEKRLKAEPSVIFVPVGQPTAEAKPVIGALELMQQ